MNTDELTEKIIGCAYAVSNELGVDLLVQQSVILELKAAKNIDKAHQAQLLNYLKATGLHTGLILNFGTARLGIKRMKFGSKTQ